MLSLDLMLQRTHGSYNAVNLKSRPNELKRLQLVVSAYLLHSPSPEKTGSHILRHLMPMGRVGTRPPATCSEIKRAYNQMHCDPPAVI